MTETALRTRTHGISYGLTAFFFAIAASQNLRYGFYPLFYGALLISLVAAAGLAYTVIMRRQQLKAPGHLWLLLAMLLPLLGAMVAQPQLAGHWIFPLVMLHLLVLPLRKGLWVSLATVFLGTAITLLVAGPLALCITLLLLGGTAALFAYRYHHNARSVIELSSTDPITGAYTLRFFEESLGQEISRSQATGRPLSLILLQLDYYDELEDLHGAVRLQTLMRAVSEVLAQRIRAGDSYYYAGDGTFLLLLPDTPEEGVRVIGERVRRTIAENDWPLVDSLSASLGCTTRLDGELEGGKLRERARRALAEAQRRGHDRVWHMAGNSD